VATNLIYPDTDSVMGEACCTHGRLARCTQDFGEEIWGKGTALKM